MTDHGLMLTTAVYAAAASAIATAGATEFNVPVAEYGLATIFSAIGIVGRHCHEASKAGSFNLKKLAFDVPTAPMLGIIIWTLLGYGDVEPAYRAGLIVGGSFLGPEALRSVLGALFDFVGDRIRSKP